MKNGELKDLGSMAEGREAVKMEKCINFDFQTFWLFLFSMAGQSSNSWAVASFK